MHKRLDFLSFVTACPIKTNVPVSLPKFPFPTVFTTLSPRGCYDASHAQYCNEYVPNDIKCRFRKLKSNHTYTNTYTHITKYIHTHHQIHTHTSPNDTHANTYTHITKRLHVRLDLTFKELLLLRGECEIRGIIEN